MYWLMSTIITYTFSNQMHTALFFFNNVLLQTQSTQLLSKFHLAEPS